MFGDFPANNTIYIFMDLATQLNSSGQMVLDDHKQIAHAVRVDALTCT
jgi:hypothetical protein